MYCVYMYVLTYIIITLSMWIEKRSGLNKRHVSIIQCARKLPPQLGRYGLLLKIVFKLVAAMARGLRYVLETVKVVFIEG